MKCRSIAASSPSGCLARIVSLTVASCCFRARPWHADHPKYDERCLTWELGSTGISLLSPCGLRGRLMNRYRQERHRAALRARGARQVGVEAQVGLWLDDNWRFQKGFGLPLSSQKPSPNAKTEQRNGDNCERKRRQPD